MEVMQEVKTKQGIEITEPKKYKVIFHNDNVTPMGVVVQILQDIFLYTKENAVVLMLQIHHKGSGIAGIYLKSIAQTRQSLSMETAKKLGYPLKVTIEKE